MCITVITAGNGAKNALINSCLSLSVHDQMGNVVGFPYCLSVKFIFYYCDESVSRGRMTGTRGRGTGTIGTKGRTEGTKERGNEKPYGLVQIEYWDRGTSTRHVWTWRGRVTLFLDV